MGKKWVIEQGMPLKGTFRPWFLLCLSASELLERQTLLPRYTTSPQGKATGSTKHIPETWRLELNKTSLPFKVISSDSRTVFLMCPHVMGETKKLPGASLIRVLVSMKVLSS